MQIDTFEFTGEGMHRVYENKKWTVGIKNYKPANDIANMDMVERHNLTDELFVLVSGSCTLISAKETPEGLSFDAVPMLRNKVYNIPATLWHNTLTRKDTKMILIEDSNTGPNNSDTLRLTEKDREKLQKLMK